MICCDILTSSANTCVNQSLGHASCVDHVFLSPDLYNTVNSAKVIDCAHNASDHRPVAIVLDEIVGSTISVHRCRSNSSKKLYKFRWDKANLNEYYAATYECLANMSPLSQTIKAVEDADAARLVNLQYENIMYALYHASRLTVPYIPINSLHHFWSDHLDELKSKSVFWESLWKDNSCPRSGTLHLIKCQASLRYKLVAVCNCLITEDSCTLQLA